jgi:hypothetical protein
VKQQDVGKILMLGIKITNEIAAEILCSHSELLQEVALHDPNHKAILVKKIVFSFITIKGKHLCRTQNIEQNSLSRHQNTKEVLFKHE